MPIGLILVRHSRPDGAYSLAWYRLLRVVGTYKPTGTLEPCNADLQHLDGHYGVCRSRKKKGVKYNHQACRSECPQNKSELRCRMGGKQHGTLWPSRGQTHRYNGVQ